LTQVNPRPASVILIQLNARPAAARILNKVQKAEVVMTELSQPQAAIFEQSVAEATTQLTKANKNAQDFLMGAQKLLLEELVFAGNEWLERSKAETQLLSEFISKMAGSHSVKDLKGMGEECAQHQIDFLRRDSERLFKHGERMIAVAVDLLSHRPN